MCGITGVWFRGGEKDVSSALRLMNQVIIHRGPDAGGIWVSPEQTGLGFGHRRLSILDLSPEGAQPKASQSGNFVITFNGEIYNFKELRSDLESRGVRFRGHSDTEVLLAGFEAWGIQKTVERAVGMFAFGVWDVQKRTLTLARDRIGEKPLYYANTPDGFVFGSELRSLKQCPGFSFSVSPESVGWYLRYGYVPAPLSIYQGVKKLLPGTIIEIRDAGHFVSEPIPYWSAIDACLRGAQLPYPGSFQDGVKELDKLLTSVIENQMLSDVPLGAFLSGGIDSSIVVALMQKISRQPVRTFSIGFDEQGYNEAPYAKAVAHHLGTNHTELYIKGSDALAVVPMLSRTFDEPFSDSSQIPTYLVSKLAKSQVTVALSGDGGDESFAGYTRYHVADRLIRSFARVPKPIASPLGGFIERKSRILAALSGQRQSKWLKLGATLKASGWEKIYDEMLVTWPSSRFPSSLNIPTVCELRGIQTTLNKIAVENPILASQILDLQTYLPDDIMVKVDRSAMAVSLESRAPFLDHRVVEFGASLPIEMKVRNGQGKAIVRELLYQYVPRTMVDRPKMGFGIPIGDWLKGPLRTWCGDLLNSKDLRNDIGVDWSDIRSIWASGDENVIVNQYRIWNAVILADWLNHQ